MVNKIILAILTSEISTELFSYHPTSSPSSFAMPQARNRSAGKYVSTVGRLLLWRIIICLWFKRYSWALARVGFLHAYVETEMITLNEYLSSLLFWYYLIILLIQVKNAKTHLNIKIQSKPSNFVCFGSQPYLWMCLSLASKIECKHINSVCLG